MFSANTTGPGAGRVVCVAVPRATQGLFFFLRHWRSWPIQVPASTIGRTRANVSRPTGAGAALSPPFRFSGRCRRVPGSGIGVIIYRCRRIRLSGFNVFFVFFDGFGVVDSDVEKFASHKQIYWCFFVLHMDIPFMPLFLGELVAHPPTGRAERRG